MSWPRTLVSGLVAIASHRLRSVLTALGILFGVGAVIATVGVGQASQQSVAQRINALGTNLLTVTPGSVTTGGVQGGLGSASTLTVADARALADHSVAPDVEAVAPVVQRSEPMANGSLTWTTTVQGSTPDWLTTNARTVQTGAFLTTADVSRGAHVAVLGATTALNLGAGVGDAITIKGIAFQVVGILQPSGSQGFANADDLAVVPLTVAQGELVGGSTLTVQRILLSATSADSVAMAQEEATDELLQTHHITDPAQPDFQITTQSQFLSTAQSVTQTLTILLASVAAISLLVGGIGVMNIMLVSVTERVTEIGLRKALGATNADIRRQFLVEAGMLSIVGAVLGIGAGMLTAVLIPRFTGIAVVLSPAAVAGAVAVAVGIGLVFGVYPAARAARLAPIEALRAQ